MPEHRVPEGLQNLRRGFEAHQRLSMLPHIDTHASYVPHITLGYVQEQHAARAIERLDRLILEQQLSCKVLGMNYGDPPN